MGVDKKIENREKLTRLVYTMKDIKKLEKEIGKKFTETDKLYEREVGEPLPRKMIEERTELWKDIEKHYNNIQTLLVEYEQNVLKKK